MVTYCVTKIVPTYSPVIGQFFDTMIVHHLTKSGNYHPSKSTSWKVLETVLSHLRQSQTSRTPKNMIQLTVLQGQSTLRISDRCWKTELLTLFFFLQSLRHSLQHYGTIWPILHPELYKSTKKCRLLSIEVKVGYT